MSHNSKGTRRAPAVVSSLLFLLLLLLPGLKMAQDYIWPTGDVSTRPLIRFDAWNTFWSSAGRYARATFGYQKELRGHLNKFTVRVLHTSPRYGVAMGKDGYLFYADPSTLSCMTRTRGFSPDELLQWQEALESWHRWLASMGSKFVFAVAPDKHSIYPEYSPIAPRPDKPTRTDQLIAHLRKHTSIPVVDLRQPLLKAKEHAKHPLYYRLDTHWTGYGAYFAYRELAATLQQWFPDLRPLQADEYTYSTGPRFSDLWFAPELAEESVRFVPTRARAKMDQAGIDQINSTRSRGSFSTSMRPDGEIDRLVMLHDSFGDDIITSLMEHTRHGVYVNSYQLEDSVVVKERPQVVISEWVERSLYSNLPTRYDGFNGVLFSEGFYPQEAEGDKTFRWMSAEGVLTVRAPIEAKFLELDFEGAAVTFLVPGQRSIRVDALNRRQKARIPIAAASATLWTTVHARAEKTRVPARESGGSIPDFRTLSARFYGASWAEAGS